MSLSSYSGISNNKTFVNTLSSTISKGVSEGVSSSVSNALSELNLGNDNGTAVNTAKISESIKKSYESKLARLDSKTTKLKDQLDALKELQKVSGSLSSSIQNIQSNSSSVFSSMQTTGVLAGVSVQPTPLTAKAGSHTLAVQSVASKQTIIIQSKDALGNPTPFTTGADVTAAGGNMQSVFAAGNFAIYSDSSGQNVIGNQIAVAAANTLAQIATSINADVVISAVLTASVITDATGDKLVLQSNSPGLENNFYIGLPGGNAAIANLSVTCDNESVQTIDVFDSAGNGFASYDDPLAGQLASFTPDIWYIGNGFIDWSQGLPGGGNPTLQDIANSINHEQAGTGVKATILPADGGGYFLRLSALPGSSLNYHADSITGLHQDGEAVTPINIRVSSYADTVAIIDGIEHNNGGSLVFNNPINDISSITVSEPTSAFTFSLTQNTDGFTDAIKNLVDSINQAQQIIAKQQEEDAPLRSNSNIYRLQNLITSFMGTSTTDMSLSKMGVAWYDYTPTSSEKAQGLVPAKYLKIDANSLASTLSTSFDAVKQFFTGTLSGGASTTNDCNISLPIITKPLSARQLEIIVTPQNDINTLPVATANGITLTVQELSQGTYMLSGQYGTEFAGMSLIFNYIGVGSAAAWLQGNLQSIMTGINVANGAAVSFSSSMNSYLDNYGTLETSINNIAKNITKSQENHLKVLERRNKKIEKAIAAANLIKFKIAQTKMMQKSLNRGNN